MYKTKLDVKNFLEYTAKFSLPVLFLSATAIFGLNHQIAMLYCNDRHMTRQQSENAIHDRYQGRFDRFILDMGTPVRELTYWYNNK